MLGVADVTAVRMVIAIARIIPTVASFGAMVFPFPGSKSAGFYGEYRRRCVSYFTLRIIVILMETIKDLYQTPTAPRPVPV